MPLISYPKDGIYGIQYKAEDFQEHGVRNRQMIFEATGWIELIKFDSKD